MPNYQEIVTTDLGALVTAADGWKSMATQFKTMEDVYEKEVQSVSSGNGWLGSSAQTASNNAAITRREFDAAQTQALAMESLLRDAHARFTDLKGRVTSAVADAVKAGMKVSDAGIASYDFSKADPASVNAIRHDPDLPEIERSWTRSIADAVKAVTEFDEDVRIALLNASGADGTSLFGFNSRAVGDVEAVEALALTQKIQSGDASRTTSSTTTICSARTRRTATSARRTCTRWAPRTPSTWPTSSTWRPTNAAPRQPTRSFTSPSARASREPSPRARRTRRATPTSPSWRA